MTTFPIEILTLVLAACHLHAVPHTMPDNVCRHAYTFTKSHYFPQEIV